MKKNINKKKKKSEEDMQDKEDIQESAIKQLNFLGL